MRSINYIKEPSIYHPYTEFEILESVETESVVEIDLNNPTEALGGFALSILQTINKYEVLNKKNLEYCVQLKNKSKWKLDNLSNALKSLRKQGLIIGIALKPTTEEDVYANTLYIITKEGAKTLSEHNIRIYNKPIPKESIDMKTIEELMTRASVNQWHISLLRNYGRRVISSKYYGLTISGGVKVPSLVEFRNITKQKREDIKIYTFPAPKEKENTKDFLLSIIKTQSYIVDKDTGMSLIIVVCESLPHAAWIASIVNKYRQTRPFYVIYTHDMVTIREDPLKTLYLCEPDGGGIIQRSLDLLK